MIDYATWQRIGHLHRVEKLTVAQIARAVSLDARTVRRWLDEPQFRARVSAARPSKLDPYKSYIVRLLETTATAPFRSSNACARPAMTAGSRS